MTEPRPRAPGTQELLDLVREAWGWCGIEPDRLIDMNAFGNLLIADKQGRTWRIIPEDPSCEIAAETAFELEALRRDPEFRFDWDMAAIVVEAQTALGRLVPGAVYHLVYPAFLGGKFEPSNMRAVPLREQVRFSGEIARQIRDMPDGAQIRLQVVD